MDFLPIFTQLQQQPVLVVGGGAVAYRKIQLLLAAGAQVTVLAKRISTEVQALQGDQLTCIEAAFGEHSIAHYKLIIAATDKPKVNAEIFQAANAANIWVNAVDDPEHGNFIFPAIVDRSPIVVAISSGGHAPVLARRLRERIEQLLPQSVSLIARFAAECRHRVKAALPSISERRDFWERWFAGPAQQLLAAGKTEQTEQLFQQQLQDFVPNQGEVWLVGAGPGDPELLTIKAMQCMQQADVLVYDGLVSADVLALARRDAERICVAKQAGFHSLPQDEINALIVRLAQEGKRVCRLKGGDPFIYGRGGEECEALVAAGIRYSVVPGVTAAAGCAAYAGIPLTHRDYAQTVQLVTGHCRANGDEPDWPSLAKARQTLVVYMGLINSGTLSQQLIAHGRSGDTPVAIIENGTRPEQRTITGTLAQLPELISEHQVKSPALIIVGEVVALAPNLHWFQTFVAEPSASQAA
ncbi:MULTISPECIES: siroheme synthase CysG [Alkalimonas]|uniref:Siroheme synthase n=1 Tax=Alkalimonas mucilaginosa TaxID=3057676 RepID=A0ABU7JFC4_9GAMM|nr:siroheme synthase CysG [Alkalimonas sp. MEB004]MEE2024384.1 siroheme synthase CysG [Alkalimonas sp. MEB004]